MKEVDLTFFYFSFLIFIFFSSYFLLFYFLELGLGLE